jgi:hypothetical protein
MAHEEEEFTHTKKSNHFPQSSTAYGVMPNLKRKWDAPTILL